MDDLKHLDFEIHCEHGCLQAAVVMTKGCGDERHYALCDRHFRELQFWFELEKPAVCAACDRPFLFFETHYDTVTI